jgi:Zinc knuckle
MCSHNDQHRLVNTRGKGASGLRQFGEAELPTEQQMQNRPQSSSACFKCGQTGHIRANCPKLELGLRTAATRQDDHADQTMDPAEDPDLLIEGEGEPQDEDQNEELIANEWEPEEAQYQFGDKEDVMEDNTVTY